MGPRVPFALLPLGIYLSNKVFKKKLSISSVSNLKLWALYLREYLLLESNATIYIFDME